MGSGQALRWLVAAGLAEAGWLIFLGWLAWQG